MPKQKSFLDFLVSKGKIDAITLDSLNKEAEETNKNIEKDPKSTIENYDN